MKSVLIMCNVSIFFVLISCTNLQSNKKNSVVMEASLSHKLPDNERRDLMFNVDFEDFGEFIIPSYSYYVSDKRLRDLGFQELEQVEGYLVNLSFKKILKEGLFLRFRRRTFNDLLYFDFEQRNNGDIIFCFIQNVYTNTGTKDSLVFQKDNDYYVLKEAYNIDNTYERPHAPTAIYKVHFIQSGNYIDLMSNLERIQSKKRYKITKFEEDIISTDPDEVDRLVRNDYKRLIRNTRLQDTVLTTIYIGN